MQADSRTRPTAVAGLFYPSDPDLLRTQVLDLLADVAVSQSMPKALIAPHAGYAYSGRVAAAAFATLRDSAQTITRVVLIGPAHYVHVRGIAGPTVDAFPSAADLVSWAGICPGNNETAGKRKSGTTRNGNRWAHKALCEAAWAASKTKATYLQAQFRRLAAIRGSKRAIIAVASTILTIGYHMLKEGTTYRELGGNYFDKRNLLRTTRRLVKRLEALGHRVILEPTQSPFQSSD